MTVKGTAIQITYPALEIRVMKAGSADLFRTHSNVLCTMLAGSSRPYGETNQQAWYDLLSIPVMTEAEQAGVAVAVRPSQGVCTYDAAVLLGTLLADPTTCQWVRDSIAAIDALADWAGDDAGGGPTLEQRAHRYVTELSRLAPPDGPSAPVPVVRPDIPVQRDEE